MDNQFKSPLDEIAEVKSDSVSVKTRLDKKAMSHLTRLNRIIDFVMIALGALGVIGHVVLSFIGETSPEPVLLVVYVAFLMFGIVMLVILDKSVKDATHDINEYVFTFTPSSVTVLAYKNGRFEGSSELMYDEFTKIKLNGDYIMLHMKDNVAFPVSRENLSEDDEARVLDWLNVAKK